MARKTVKKTASMTKHQPKTGKKLIEKRIPPPRISRKDGYSEKELAHFREIILQKKKEIRQLRRKAALASLAPSCAEL